MEDPKPPSPRTGWDIRLATLLFPPAGLVLLLRSRPDGGRLVSGCVFVALYSVLYCAVSAMGLVKFGVLHLEWRGEGFPHLTATPTKPDYDRLEAHRAKQPDGAQTHREGGTVWSGFRGADRRGRYAETPLNLRWDQSPPQPLWKQPIGGGYASFAIAHGTAFTIEQRREEEVATAYDLATGRELWATGWRARFSEQMGGDGPRATPAWHGGRVYCIGATGELRCLDAGTGQTLWRRNVLTDTISTPLYFGGASSPLIQGEAVIAMTGEPAGSKGRAMIAYSRDTGEPLWQALQQKAAYSSPVLAQVNGVSQLMSLTGFNLVSLSPADGEILWSHPWEVEYNNSIAQPVLVATNQIFISAGYGKGCALLEIKTENGQWSVEERWRNLFMKNKFASSVLHDGYLYGLDNDIMVCLDAHTGRKQWKDGRYGYGQIILVHDHVLVLCGDGDLALVKCNPSRHEEIARIPALEGKTWNHPAISDGLLLIRNHATMACYDLRP